MKKLLLATTILTMSSTSAFANGGDFEIPGEFDSYVTFTNNYVFRGISQSDEGPAIQGGIDWSHESGVYAGVWGSSVDFDDDTDFELDIFVGYSDQLVEDVTYDLSLIYYAYPGSDQALDFVEVYGALSYDLDFASVTGSVNYSPNNFNDSGNATYLSVAVDVPLPHGFSLSGHVGSQTIEDEDAFGAPDYVDYGVSVNYGYQDFAFSLGLTGTDLNENDVADNAGEQVVFSVSASF